jgi:type III restriction enzyme
MIKLQFEPNLQFQRDAIDAVANVFQGQENARNAFSVIAPKSALFQHALETATGNRLRIDDEQLLENLRGVQLHAGLAQEQSVDAHNLNITVEMETGTGKTYVYLRTIYELHRRYGFTKFIIVVPSIAVREGVAKTLRITEEHFRGLYDGVPVKSFVYNSERLGEVRDFVLSGDIRIMVTTVAAISKESNIFNQRREDLNDEKPVDLVRATRPIVIVDEPQSVEGERGFEAIQKLTPLCTLRYSATHKKSYTMVYRLDPIDAYDKKLVKRIEVAGLVAEDTKNRPYVRFLKTKQEDGTVKAVVELDVQQKKEAKTKEVKVRDGDHLQETTKRELYAEHRIGTIRADSAPGGALLEVKLPGTESVFLRPGESLGSIDFGKMQRAMIRRTIDEHLRKERVLNPRGIKVLSLFFVANVNDYRLYDGDTAQKGPLAVMFEEEWEKAKRDREHNDLFRNVSGEAGSVHNGYFSQDKAGKLVDTSEKNEKQREDAARAYDLIMKDKEKLLSLSEPLRFIFSHSALKEGWDNPNVFQICILRDMKSEGQRRQTIGRGMRLCVDDTGARVRDEAVNRLTVIANEDYEKFAEALQSEIEDETGVRFGIIEQHAFAHIPTTEKDGTAGVFGEERSRDLWQHLRAEDYIDDKGRVQDTLRFELANGNLSLPEDVQPIRSAVVGVLLQRTRKLEIGNANAPKTKLRTRERILQDTSFLALWDRIKHKTKYRVRFDNESLIKNCIKAIQQAPKVPRARIRTVVADVDLKRGGVVTNETEKSTTVLIEDDLPIPDVLTELEAKTRLTRKSLSRILLDCGRLDELRANPSRFLTETGERIEQCKRKELVDGIKYEKIGDSQYYAQELFGSDELIALLDSCVAAEKSVHEQVKVDSKVERAFVDDLEKNPAIKLYAKLPPKFQIQTPLGGYNPDWAIVVTRPDGGAQLYFVVETKSSVYGLDLRDKERAKIECGRRHFEALAEGDNPAQFAWGTNLDDILSAHPEKLGEP